MPPNVINVNKTETTMGPSTTVVAWAICGYMVCSATLLIGNKYAVYRVAAPSFILWAQLFGTTVAVKAAYYCGLIVSLDEIELSLIHI